MQQKGFFLFKLLFSKFHLTRRWSFAMAIFNAILHSTEARMRACCYENHYPDKMPFTIWLQRSSRYTHCLDREGKFVETPIVWPAIGLAFPGRGTIWKFLSLLLNFWVLPACAAFLVAGCRVDWLITAYRGLESMITTIWLQCELFSEDSSHVH